MWLASGSTFSQPVATFQMSHIVSRVPPLVPGYNLAAAGKDVVVSTLLLSCFSVVTLQGENGTRETPRERAAIPLVWRHGATAPSPSQARYRICMCAASQAKPDASRLADLRASSQQCLAWHGHNLACVGQAHWACTEAIDAHHCLMIRLQVLPHSSQPPPGHIAPSSCHHVCTSALAGAQP